MSENKVRTQIYLDRESYEWLKTRSERNDLSIGHQIREAVARYVVEQNAATELPTLNEDDAIWGLIGMGESEQGDLAENHNHYLYGAPKLDEDA